MTYSSIVTDLNRRLAAAEAAKSKARYEDCDPKEYRRLRYLCVSLAGQIGERKELESSIVSSVLA